MDKSKATRQVWWMLAPIATALLVGTGCPRLTASYSQTGARSTYMTEGCRFAIYTVRPQARFGEVGFVRFDFQGATTTEGPKTLAEVRRIAGALVCRAGGNALLLEPANDLGMFKTATILKISDTGTPGRDHAGTRRAAAPRPAPRAWPDSVPFLTELRMGQPKEAVARVLLAYARRGFWRPDEIREGHRHTSSRAASGGPVETHIGPETLTTPVHTLPWPGRNTPLSGLRGRLELRFRKGRLTKVKLNAQGAKPPASFTKPHVAAYLRRLNPKLRIRIAEDRFKLKGKAGGFEVEVEYDPRKGALELEVEQDLSE